MTLEEVLTHLDSLLDQYSKEIEATGSMTLEQSTALLTLKGAGVYVYSTIAWLNRHDLKYGNDCCETRVYSDLNRSSRKEIGL